MSYTIIDVRSPEEYKTGHVSGSLNIPLDQIGPTNSRLDGVAKDADIIVYCRTGNRANTAQRLLQELRYTHVTNGINQAHVESTV